MTEGDGSAGELAAHAARQPGSAAGIVLGVMGDGKAPIDAAAAAAANASTCITGFATGGGVGVQ